MNDTSSQVPSVWSRRFKYGLLVGLLVVAALAIVILLNVIAVRNVSRWGSWTRLDLTATREYTLSPQTRQVLGNLKQDVTIVTLFLTGSDADPATAEKIRYFSDLLDEYERWGHGRVKVQHLQPAIDVEKFRDLCTQIAARYKDQFSPAQNALNQAKQTLQQVSEFGKSQALLFTQRLPLLKSKSDQQLAQMLQQITQAFSTLDNQLQIADTLTAIDKISRSPLPDFAAAKSQAAEPLRQLRDNLLIPADKVFDQRINSGDTNPDVKDFLTGVRDAFKKMLDPVNKAIDTLDSVNTGEYDAVRSSIMRANSSVVMTPDRLTVIKLDDVYTDSAPNSDDSQQQQVPQQRFRGEESVTSAIISLTLKVKPLVVFVNTTQQPVVQPGGAFSYVASRLRNMNFQVKEWNPAGRRSQYGMMPPEPKPQPDKGQPIVWILLPAAPPDPRMPMMPQTSQIADILKDAIKDGQPAFVILAPNPMARFGQQDPVADALTDLGIKTDEAVQATHMVTNPRTGQLEAASQFALTDWPKDHPIGKALAGQVGILLSSMPLTLTPKGDAKVWPLIQTPADAWAETDLGSRQPRHDANEKSGPFTVAAAFSDRNERLVILTDPYFATDQFTQYGPRDVLSGRLLHTLFPANSELFTDSVYWLAGQDDLIAAGARTQDVRRYSAISTSAHIAVWWIVLVGLPVLCLIAGTAVWIVRRK